MRALKKIMAALALTAVLAGCSAHNILSSIQGGKAGTVQTVSRPAVESAELQFTHPAAGDTIAVFDTSAGVFRAVLFPEKAPQACDNFIGLVQQGYYNGLTVSRVENQFVVEAGQGADGKGSTIWKGSRYPVEASDSLHHYAGALCMGVDASGECASVFYVVESLPGEQSVTQELVDQMNAAGYRAEVVSAYQTAGGAPYLDYTDTPLIVAAVECNAGANNERLVEYSPYRFDDKQYGHFDGKGKDTLNWFVHEFKPYIDANYRTEPDRAHTFIGGSSMGGLMSLYALLQYSDVFGRAAALSPSLWVAPEALTALVGRCKLAPGTVLYMDYGSREMGNHDGMRKGFGEMCSKIFARGINLTARVVPGGNHSEASWEKQLPFVFHTLMYELD